MVRRRTRLALGLVAGAGAVALLGAVLIQGVSLPKPVSEAESSLPITQYRDDPAPRLEGQTLTGQAFDLNRWRGRVAVVSIIASWCAACRAEMPVLATTTAQWPSGDVQVIGVAMRDTAADAMQLLRDTGATSVTVMADPDGTKSVNWGVRGVPETFVVDREGHMRLHAFGAIDLAWIQRELPPIVRP